MGLKADMQSYCASRIQHYLAEAGGNVSLAARLADYDRSSFYKLARSVGVSWECRQNRGNAAWRALGG